MKFTTMDAKRSALRNINRLFPPNPNLLISYLPILLAISLNKSKLIQIKIVTFFTKRITLHDL